jgi:hypothetical protein
MVARRYGKKLCLLRYYGTCDHFARIPWVRIIWRSIVADAQQLRLKGA